MSQVKDTQKNRVLNGLSVCLKSLKGYDANNIMPLLYVLCAHHEGHLLSIVGSKDNIFDLRKEAYLQPVETLDGEESILLKEIRSSVPESCFKGQAWRIISEFYSLYSDFINEFYTEMIEYILSYYSEYSGIYSNLSMTPKEVVELMSQMVSKNTGIMYDPCAGLCGFAIDSHLARKNFVLQEINPTTKVIADVRLNAHKKDLTCLNEDAVSQWRGNDASCLISDLPLGVRLSTIYREECHSLVLEDLIIERFMKSPSLRQAVLLVSNGTLFRGNNFPLRKDLCERNYVDKVIELPSGLLPSTGISVSVLCLNKDKKDRCVTFVYAADCIIKGATRKSRLDLSTLLNRLSNHDNQCAIVDVEATFKNDCILSPMRYIDAIIQVLPGQQVVNFVGDVAQEIRGVSNFDEKEGKVLSSEDFTNNIAEFQSTKHDLKVEELDSHYVKVQQKCIVFNFAADKFYIHDNNSPLFLKRNYRCFAVNEEKYNPVYIAFVLLQEQVQKIIRTMVNYSMSRGNFKLLKLPVYLDKTSQANILRRAYNQERSKLKEKLQKLEVLGDKSSGLIHNLGITFTKIGAEVNVLKNNDSSPLIEALDDNVRFALRQINSSGADFSLVSPELEKVNLVDTIKDYLQGWGNYGFKSFDILPLKVEIPDITKVEIDKDLFYTMMDCIFINAHQHGFNKKMKEGNTVVVSVHAVQLELENQGSTEDYALISVSNNGNPFPDGFTLKDFTTRGLVGINSSQDGLGGDHIAKIAHQFHGKVSLDNDSNKVTINILLPIYTTSDNINYENYEIECI